MFEHILNTKLYTRSFGVLRMPHEKNPKDFDWFQKFFIYTTNAKKTVIPQSRVLPGGPIGRVAIITFALFEISSSLPLGTRCTYCGVFWKWRILKMALFFCVFWRLDELAFLDPITLVLNVLWLVLNVLAFIDDIFSPLGSRGSLTMRP